MHLRIHRRSAPKQRPILTDRLEPTEENLHAVLDIIKNLGNTTSVFFWMEGRFSSILSGDISYIELADVSRETIEKTVEKL